jgi:membrane protease YdiL (CAAX protease family)
MKKKHYPQTYLQSLVLIIFPLFFVSPFVFLRKLIFFTENIFAITLFGIYFFALLMFYFFKNDKQINFNFKINKIIILLILLIFFFQVGIHVPLNLYLYGFNASELSKINTTFIISQFIALIITAIIEEFIFRGMILKGYLMKYKPIKAIIVSAVFFGIIHLNPLQIFGAITLGLITGYVYYYSKSIGITIILHVLYNITAYVFIFLKNNYVFLKIKKTSNSYEFYSKYTMIISFLIFVYLLYYVSKNKNNIIVKLKKLDN